jgi:hypothetical protein
MDKNGNLPLYGEIISGACVSNLDSVHCLLKYFACLFYSTDLSNIYTCSMHLVTFMCIL